MTKKLNKLTSLVGLAAVIAVASAGSGLASASAMKVSALIAAEQSAAVDKGAAPDPAERAYAIAAATFAARAANAAAI